MDFGQALTFQFQDPAWQKKVLLPALVSLIPVFGWLVVWGWSLQITARVIRRERDLPELELGNDLMRGLKALLVVSLYNLPAVLAGGVAAAFTMVQIVTREYSTGGVLAAGVTLLCLGAGVFALGLAAAPLVFAGLGRMMAMEEDLAPALRLGDVAALIRKAPAAYFLVLMGQFLCFWITLFGAVACILGVLVMANYTLTVMAHLFGQAYLEASGKE